MFSLKSRKDVVRYALRRAGKILPPFYLVLLLNGVMLLFWKGGAGVLPAMLAYATTYAHFTPRYAGFDPVCWSLFIEIHFYVLLPLIYLLLRRTTPQAGWITLLLFFVIPPLVRFSTPYPLSDGYVVWFFKWNLFPRALDFFAGGILFALIFNRWKGSPALKRFARPLAFGGAVLLLISIGVGAYLRFRIDHFDSNINREPVWEKELFRYLVCASTFLLLFLVFDSRTLLLRALTFAPLRYLGLISYELYLIHLPILEIFDESLPPPHNNLWIGLEGSAVPVALSVLLAVLIFHFFSSPILERVKGYAKTVR